MDLSGLRQSLHRLALLEDGDGGNQDPSNNNSKQVGVTLSKVDFGGLLRDAGAPPPPQQQHNQESHNGSGVATKCEEEKKRCLKPCHLPRPDPIVALLRAGEGGGIRVYNNEVFAHHSHLISWEISVSMWRFLPFPSNFGCRENGWCEKNLVGFLLYFSWMWCHLIGDNLFPLQIDFCPIRMSAQNDVWYNAVYPILTKTSYNCSSLKCRI